MQKGIYCYRLPRSARIRVAKNCKIQSNIQIKKVVKDVDG